MKNDALWQVFLILYEYTSHNWILDKNAVERMIKVYLSTLGYDGLVLNLEIDDSVYGSYDEVSRTVYLGFNKINKIAHDMQIDKNCIYYVNAINRWIIIILFHELRHAMQFNLPHLPHYNGVVEKIFYYTCKDANCYSMLYDELHDNFATERDANIFAYEQCLILYQWMNNYYCDNLVIKHLCREFIEMFLYGYKKNAFFNNPLKRVIFSTSSIKCLTYYKYLLFEKLIELNKVGLYERLRFGFPIKDEEYDYLFDILNNIDSYQIQSLDMKQLILSKR